MSFVRILPRFALASMILMIIIPYTLMPTWAMRVYISTSGVATMFQIGGLLAFLILASPLILKGLRVKHSNVLLLGGAYFLLALATAPMGIKPLNSVIYTVLMLVFILMCMTVVREGDFSKSLALSNRIVTFVIIGIMLAFPYNGSTFGGIQPNTFSKSCLTIFCLSYADPSRFFRIFAKTVAILAVIFVTSRSAGIAIILMYFVSAVISLARQNSMSKTYIASLWFGLLVFVLFGLFYGINPTSVENFFYSAIDQNIENRFDAWEASIYGIQQSPIFGHGFRSRAGYELNVSDYTNLKAVNAHNGYINSILDVGLLGTSIMLLLWITEIMKNFKALSKNTLPRSSRNILMCFTTAMAASLFTWLSEPLTFNFGNPWSLLLIFAIFTSAEVRSRGHQIRTEQASGTNNVIGYLSSSEARLPS